MKTKEELEAIVAKVKEDYVNLRSLSVSVEKGQTINYIKFDCARYKGGKNENYITRSQSDYIKELCDYQSSSNLGRINKWCASAIITIVKEYNIDKEQTYVVS